eukprot:749703-Hanusia_phi.AAC.1
MEEGSIYLRNFQKALLTIDAGSRGYSELFDEEEKTVCELFLRGNGSRCMSQQARGTYTRMIQRKGPWFRLESLMNYPELLLDRAEEIDESERWARTERAMQELQEFGFVSYVGCKTRCEKAKIVEAIRSCCKLPEVKQMLQKLTRGQTTSLTKAEALMSLEKAIMGQKTILDFWTKREGKDDETLPTNSPVWMELEKILIPPVVREGREGSEGRARMLFVRLEQGPVKLFKRILRLMHITSIFSVEHYTSLNRPVFNPAILTEFGKMKYAGSSSSAFLHSLSGRVQTMNARRRLESFRREMNSSRYAESLMVQGVEQFETFSCQWEAAVELRTMAESLVMNPGDEMIL